jgi:chromosomal replication initiation ATPase DnaA
MLSLTKKQTVEELETTIEEETSDVVLKQAKINLLRSVGALSFSTWFISPLWEKTNQGVVLRPENNFKSDYIENHFREALKSGKIRIVRAGE